MNTDQARSFRLCVIITLFRVYRICTRFDDLDFVSRSHVYQKQTANNLCRFFFSSVFQCVLSASLKRSCAVCSFNCDVYLREVVSTFFLVRHLNLESGVRLLFFFLLLSLVSGKPFIQYLSHKYKITNQMQCWKYVLAHLFVHRMSAKKAKKKRQNQW